MLSVTQETVLPVDLEALVSCVSKLEIDDKKAWENLRKICSHKKMALVSFLDERWRDTLTLEQRIQAYFGENPSPASLESSLRNPHLKKYEQAFQTAYPSLTPSILNKLREEGIKIEAEVKAIQDAKSVQQEASKLFKSLMKQTPADVLKTTEDILSSNRSPEAKKVLLAVCLTQLQTLPLDAPQKSQLETQIKHIEAMFPNSKELTQPISNIRSKFSLETSSPAAPPDLNRRGNHRPVFRPQA